MKHRLDYRALRERHGNDRAENIVADVLEAVPVGTILELADVDDPVRIEKRKSRLYDPAVYSLRPENGKHGSSTVARTVAVMAGNYDETESRLRVSGRLFGAGDDGKTRYTGRLDGVENGRAARVELDVSGTTANLDLEGLAVADSPIIEGPAGSWYTLLEDPQFGTTLISHPIHVDEAGGYDAPPAHPSSDGDLSGWAEAADLEDVETEEIIGEIRGAAETALEDALVDIGHRMLRETDGERLREEAGLR